MPEAFGPYRVVEPIGTGRFGPAYRAREAATGLFVAIKVFDQGLTVEQASRLAIALRNLGHAPLNHPAIVPIIAADSAQEHAWLAEPWFNAVPLDVVMQSDRVPALDETLVRITHAAAALDFAAAAGIHHGALHPREMLVAGDQTVLTGLGVLQALSDAGLAVPMSGAYVSPQRASGQAPTAPDDVYSLAAIAYELISNLPVPAYSELKSAIARLTHVDRSRLADILERALSPDPRQRPATALALAAAIQDAVLALAPEVEPAAPPAAAVPAADPSPDLDDLPLRTALPEGPHPDVLASGNAELEFESELAFESEVESKPKESASEFESEFESESTSASESELEPESESESESESSPRPNLWLPVCAALAIGLLLGFASGYVSGERDAMNASRAPEQSLVRDGSAGTSGNEFTESTVPPPNAESNPAPGASVPRSSGAAAQTTDQAGSPVDPTEPGSLHVDSRPRGARVFVDGHLVGATPVMVSDVKPGAHAVRIDLRGYRRWVTSVDVAPGERQRVAASLER